MYERILLPTDGSEAASKAAEHAYSLAKQYNAELHVLFVVKDIESASIVGRGADSYESREARGKEATTELAKPARDLGIDTKEVVRAGDVHHQIIEYARENDVDVIVMCTHGRSGVDKFLLGSVTDRVLRKGDIPVLAIKR